MYTSDEQNAIILSSFANLHYSAHLHFIKTYAKSDGSLIKTLSASVYNSVREQFFDAAYRSGFFENLKKRNITCITYYSANYPEELKSLPHPPLVLYCKGNAGLLNERKFTVVGSRKSLPQTLALCKKLTAELVKEFALVSGIAEGADAAAVGGALSSGKVICVLAYGFDHIYPVCNARLLKSVAKSGLVISEYPPAVAPQRYLFPFRNRILAALGEGTLVVSAGERSGAKITAELAEEYSKYVFAVPYSPGIQSGAGCNELIKKGAYLTENILDIFSVFGLDFTTAREERLTDGERAVVDFIKSRGTAFLPDIAAALGKATYELLPAITSLEIKKIIIRLGGNRYGLID